MIHRKKAKYALFIISVVLVAALPFAARGDDELLVRKLGPFELGATRGSLENELRLFKCAEHTIAAYECRLYGYPGRDDFLVIKFWKGKIAGIAEFRGNVDWEKTIEKTREMLGEPTLPAYQSDKAISYIWQDKMTHITITYLIGPAYVIYEIRDRATEPLYRRSAKFKQ